VKLRDNLFALIVHAGILVIIAVVILLTSCQKEATTEPNPAELFFKEMKKALDTASIQSVTILQVNDSIAAGGDLKRQVYEEILNNLHKLSTLNILEYPQSRIESAFKELGIIPADGIAPEDIVELGQRFQTQAFIYASIESRAPDVHFKVYSAQTGSIIFANTLSNWALPVSKEAPPSLPPEMASNLGEAESKEASQ